MRWLNRIPSILASRVHVTFLILLGIGLIILPLAGVHIAVKWELIGGNYTNVTSDIGACIAAGGTVHLINRGRARHSDLRHEFRLIHDTLRKLHDKVDKLGGPDVHN